MNNITVGDPLTNELPIHADDVFSTGEVVFAYSQLTGEGDYYTCVEETPGVRKLWRLQEYQYTGPTLYMT